MVELLVVIAIIGVLIALLLPAIQAARESARITQCRNNLHQISAAMLHYESTHQFFPAGGWSSKWIGDPNVGTGPRQPGSWIYQSLPFLEQQSISSLGLGMEGDDLKAALTEVGKSVIPILNCPSRRSAELYPALDWITWNYSPLEYAAKSDYAANGGNKVNINRVSGPIPRFPFVRSDCREGFPACNWMTNLRWTENNWNGIVGDHSGASIRSITDGTFQTFLAGEKWVLEMYYSIVSIDASADNSTNRMAADNPGDKNSMFVGFDYDTVRVANDSSLPKRDSEYDLKNGQQDKKGTHFQERFGSAHTAGVNLAKCDGSVSTWNFDVDSSVWSNMGAKDDGKL